MQFKRHLTFNQTGVMLFFSKVPSQSAAEFSILAIHGTYKYLLKPHPHKTLQENPRFKWILQQSNK